jgi:hypothetical protein
MEKLKLFFNKNLLFLKSVRFWKLVAVAIINLLANEGILSTEVAVALTTILIGSVAVRTLDRMGDKLPK